MLPNHKDQRQNYQRNLQKNENSDNYELTDQEMREMELEEEKFLHEDEDLFFREHTHILQQLRNPNSSSMENKGQLQPGQNQISHDGRVYQGSGYPVLGGQGPGPGLNQEYPQHNQKQTSNMQQPGASHLNQPGLSSNPLSSTAASNVNGYPSQNNRGSNWLADMPAPTNGQFNSQPGVGNSSNYLGGGAITNSQSMPNGLSNGASSVPRMNGLGPHHSGHQPGPGGRGAGGVGQAANNTYYQHQGRVGDLRDDRSQGGVNHQSQGHRDYSSGGYSRYSSGPGGSVQGTVSSASYGSQPPQSTQTTSNPLLAAADSNNSFGSPSLEGLITSSNRAPKRSSPSAGEFDDYEWMMNTDMDEFDKDQTKKFKQEDEEIEQMFHWDPDQNLDSSLKSNSTSSYTSSDLNKSSTTKSSSMTNIGGLADRDYFLNSKSQSEVFGLQNGQVNGSARAVSPSSLQQHLSQPHSTSQQYNSQNNSRGGGYSSSGRNSRNSSGGSNSGYYKTGYQNNSYKRAGKYSAPRHTQNPLGGGDFSNKNPTFNNNRYYQNQHQSQSFNSNPLSGTNRVQQSSSGQPSQYNINGGNSRPTYNSQTQNNKATSAESDNSQNKGNVGAIVNSLKKIGLANDRSEMNPNASVFIPSWLANK